MSDPSTRYVVAVDVGQANDYTALCIIQSYRLSAAPGADRHLDLVHLERFREMSYPDQVRRIAERYRELQQHARQAHRSPTLELVVDATGVGKPILDLAKEHGLRARGVIITGGETASYADGIDRVPKRELVTTLQVALQTRRLRIAEDLPLAEHLLQEMRGFRVKISLTGHASFGNDVGAWREAEHDDLVLATALGVWVLENRKTADLAVLRRAAGLPQR